MTTLKRVFAVVFGLLLLVTGLKAEERKISITVLQKQIDKNIKLDYHTWNRLRKTAWMRAEPIQISGGVSFSVNTDLTLVVYLDKHDLVPGKDLLAFMAEPGDSVVFDFTGVQPRIAGHGSEKYELQFKIFQEAAKIIIPSNPRHNMTNSVQDYNDWDEYFAEKVSRVLPMIESFKGKVDSKHYEWLKCGFLNGIIDGKSEKFLGLISWNKRSHVLSSEQITEIYDKSYFPLSDSLFRYISSRMFGSWKPVWLAVDRKYQFNYVDSTINTWPKKRFLYYKHGIRVYKGIAREQFIHELMGDLIIDELFSPEIEKLLSDYYGEKSYPEYKGAFREKELVLRTKINERKGLQFNLIDHKGKLYTQKDFAGKITVYFFRSEKCKDCDQSASGLKKVQEYFKKDLGIRFVEVVDNGKILDNKQFYANKDSSGNSFIRKLGIQHFPAIRMINSFNKVVSGSTAVEVCSERGREQLKRLLEKQLASSNDGPYIFHESGKEKVVAIREGKARVNLLIPGDDKLLEVATDNPRLQFKVKLRKKLQNEHFEFEAPKKLFALSDIEGNFYALRNLLQQHKVIDKDLNWIFGDGHLVFAGDMFDRGDQVTECLWLVYALEEQAKAAGGYVHFILGNHEIMNLQGNQKYVHQKYQASSELVGKKLQQIYDENSELGKWLRTKNIVEKIGNILFVHGGIGVEFNEQIGIGVSNINTAARPHYADPAVYSTTDKDVGLIFHSKFGPLWYRYYYEKEDGHYQGTRDTTLRFTIKRPMLTDIDSIMRKWNVDRIVTGHTIVADTISTHYNNRVINTDVPHAKGKSEALLIEGSAFYRVNDKGERKLLFRDPEEKDKIKK